MYLIRNTLIGILVTLVLVFGISAWIEVYTYNQEALDMQTFVQLAAEDAIKQTQNLYLQSDKGGDVFKYNDYPDDFKFKLQQAALEATRNIRTGYIDIVYKQAQDMGLTAYAGGTPSKNDTDLFFVLGNISKWANSNDLAQGMQHGVTWNPLQYGLTYIDPKVVELIFRQNIRKLIEMNYGPEVERNFWGWNKLEYNDAGTSVHVSQPKLVMFDASSQEGRLAYETLFGNTFAEKDALYSQLNRYESDLKRYDAQIYYCIAYELEFSVAAWHNTRTLAFKLMSDDALIGLPVTSNYSMGPPFDEGGRPTSKYLQMPMQPTVFKRHYVFTN